MTLTTQTNQPAQPALARPAPTSRARFWHLNIFIVLAMGCNFLNAIYYGCDGMAKSATIEVCGVAILFGLMLMNLRGYFETTKVLSIIFVNAHSTCLCYVQGSYQGAYLYLFPFVMAMIFFLRMRKTNRAVTIFVIATTLNLLAIVLFMPYKSALEPVTEAASYHHLVVNIIVNFLLVIIFFYFVLQLLDAKEKRNKLSEAETLLAKEKAEKAAAAKVRFMSNMSHELRTPLNAIIGTTHLLVSDHETLRESEHFKVLKDSSEHMLQLVNAVLDFSKLDEGKLEIVQAPFDVAQTLQQAVDAFVPVVQQKQIRLALDIGGIPPGKKLLGDEMRLKQVVLNLLSNAVKFTEHGVVTLTSRFEETDETSATVYFAIDDTGIGIPPEKIHLIFESFTQVDAETTRKYGGSGLGLSICKELISKMGGELQVKSEPDKGSVFYFTIRWPFLQRGALAPREKLQGLEKLTGVKILLVEDNPTNVRIARRFLDSWGADIHTAENGQVAWDLFQQESYDLLLVDLEMPLMDGKALLTQVRSINKAVPAIAFTAAVYDNMQEDLALHGFDGFLHKPFRPDEMHRKILFHLGG